MKDERALSFSECLTEVKELRLDTARPIGSWQSGIYGGYGSLEPGTCRLPRLAFHCLAILPGGEFDFQIENGRSLTPRRFAPEDLAFIPAHHKIRVNVPSLPTLIGMPTNSAAARAVTSYFRLLFPIDYLQGVLAGQSNVLFDTDTADQAYVGRPTRNFRQLARMVRLEFEHAKAGDQQMLDALVRALLIELFRLLHDVKTLAFEPAILSDAQISKALDLMQLAIDGSSSLGDIAEELGVTPSTFTRQFKARLNSTPSEYLSELRLEKSKQLLLETDISLARIAYECGFSSQAHFTTRFSTAFGTTPARFRARS